MVRSMLMLVALAMLGACGTKADPVTWGDDTASYDTVGVDTIPGQDTVAPPDTVQPKKTTWADVKTLLGTRCGNCHNAYNSYSGAKKQGKKGLNSVLNNSMPTGKKFTTAEKELYKAWYYDGMLP